jgi:hypothetical protein
MAFSDGGYGYQWWMLPADGHKSFAALDLGGQVLWVIPDLKLIMVVLADPNGPSNNPVPFDDLRQELPRLSSLRSHDIHVMVRPRWDRTCIGSVLRCTFPEATACGFVICFSSCFAESLRGC